MDKWREEMMKNRLPVHEKCRGIGLEDSNGLCDRIEISEQDKETCFCKIYMIPAAWWQNKKYCPMASHYNPDSNTKKGKVRVGQQKQKGR